MDNLMVAPCGVVCDLCSAFQRKRNKCVGCNNDDNNRYHYSKCSKCKIKNCLEKNGNGKLLCNICNKFPCRLIIKLDVRYRVKYGESPIENLHEITRIGIKDFMKEFNKKWKCKKCSNLLCVHRGYCLFCKEKNPYNPYNPYNKL